MGTESMNSNGLPNYDLTEVTITDPAGIKRKIPTRIAGAGQPILFLHGYPLDGRIWEPVMARLSDRFRCIAPDLRGFGDSAEEAKSFSMLDLANDVEALVKSLGVSSKISICGLSMGGYVAMQFAKTHPESVCRLLLTNTRGNADDAQTRQTRLDAASKAVAGQSEQVVAPMLEKLLSEKTRKEEAHLESLVLNMMNRTKPSTIAWAQLAMAHREDSLKAMDNWHFPTLCVAGEHDKITPPEALQQIAAALPNASVHVDANSAHLTPLESPDWFAKRVADLFAMECRSPSCQ